MNDNVTTLAGGGETDLEDAKPPRTKSIWNQKTLDRVKDYATVVEDVGNSRAALNAKLAAARAVLIDAGLNKDALDAALKYAQTPEDKRENWDLTYLYCRNAYGAPVQDDLFVAALQEQVEASKPAKKH